MVRNGVVSIACVGSFIVGWACNALVGHVEMPTRVPVPDASAFGRDVTERLARIEAILDRASKAPDATMPAREEAPFREPVRDSNATDLAQVVRELKVLLADRQTGQSGFDELLHDYALPNEAVLNKMRDDFAKDQSAPQQAIIGMDCHDLIRGFGAPTIRRLVSSSSQGVQSEWVWDLPSSDSCFSVSFVNNVPLHCFFYPRKYLENR